jgi:NADH-quinone oxidoreductase subunit I
MRNAVGYVREIVRGAQITSRHFFVNMARHSLTLLGLRPRRPGAVTVQYPEQRKAVAPRYRSLHRLVRREDGRPRCVACMLCATVCPSECISIEAGEDPDPEVQRSPSRYAIDLSRCCFCGFCVEACPEDAIRMDTGILESAEGSRVELVYEKEDLLG